MIKENVGTYTVGANEEVTVEVIAIETANTASFVVDIGANEISDDPLTFVFRVTKKAGQTHFGEVRCAFSGPPDPNADDPRFEVFLTGSLGGGRLTGPVIRRSDPDHLCDLAFERP
ncbi:MAG: hypothetical protein V7638_1033 [Acidobacteriota bacterium]|jgi:hypothetical protein